MRCLLRGRDGFVGGLGPVRPAWLGVCWRWSQSAVLAPNARTGSWLQRPWPPWDLAAFFRAVFSSHPRCCAAQCPSRHLHFVPFRPRSGRLDLQTSLSPFCILHSPRPRPALHTLQIPASLPLSTVYLRNPNCHPIHHQLDIRLRTDCAVIDDAIFHSLGRLDPTRSQFLTTRNRTSVRTTNVPYCPSQREKRENCPSRIASQSKAQEQSMPRGVIVDDYESSPLILSPHPSPPLAARAFADCWEISCDDAPATPTKTNHRH